METKHKTFKPFDKVLVRSGKGYKWRANFYSYFNGNQHVCINNYLILDVNILPYEGNEHLVGTTDEPEEEVKLEEGEWIIGMNHLSEFLNETHHGYIGAFRGLKRIYASEDKRFDVDHSVALFAIPFSKFNPNDMEETRKHILCVKNGKVVKYKG